MPIPAHCSECDKPLPEGKQCRCGEIKIVCCCCGSDGIQPALKDSLGGIFQLSMLDCSWCPNCKVHVRPIWLWHFNELKEKGELAWAKKD